MAAQIIELIVLSLTKVGETALVIHTLSREFGRCGFLVRSGKKAGMSLFLPMNVIEAEVVENSKSSLKTIRNVSSKYPLGGIRDNIYKNSMTMFLSEVLFRIVSEGACEEGLYEWCERQILALDALQGHFSNYHLWFLLDLASALGFSPSAEDLSPFTGKETAAKLLGSSFEDFLRLPFCGEQRNLLCEDILKYLQFHLDYPVKVKSLAVLRELFV